MKKITFLLFIGVTTFGYSQRLYKAVEKGDIEKVKSLIKKNADISKYNKKGLFPLWRATADNNYEISELLIKNLLPQTYVFLTSNNLSTTVHRLPALVPYVQKFMETQNSK